MYKMTFPSFVSTAVFLLCLLTACKKGNNEWPGPGGKDNCKCDVERFDVYRSRYPEVPPFYYNKGCRFRKTYHPDGSLKHISADIGGPLSPQEYNGYVNKLGNRVIMIDSANLDTLLIAELNDKGLPVSSRLRDYSNRNYRAFNYTYNAQGKLIYILRDLESVGHSFQYDQYGNLISFFSQTMTYDYNTPIKGGEYLIEFNDGNKEVELLSYLGYIDIAPRHKMLSSENHDYPLHKRLYINQQINADGYVTAFETTLWWDDDPLIITTPWHCIKNNQHPKPSLH